MEREEPLLTPEQIIKHMKKEGITFNKTAEKDAREFLKKNNYYKKLSSYRNNYEVYASEDGTKKFKDLDFAYLHELSYIDMELRYFVIRMCLDIEHYLKVRLLNLIEKNQGENEDGYTIVDDFVKYTSDKSGYEILEGIRVRNNNNNRYCKNLIQKYLGNATDVRTEVPIWVLVELIPFGTLVDLCDYYEEKYGKKVCETILLYGVRDIRNACAHSNCLINNLKDRSIKTVPYSIKKRIKDIWEIKDYPTWDKMIQNYFIYDFVCLLYAYYDIVSDIDRKKALFTELQTLFENRMLEHKKYFEGNKTIVDSYRFVKVVFDHIHDDVRIEKKKDRLQKL